MYSEITSTVYFIIFLILAVEISSDGLDGFNMNDAVEGLSALFQNSDQNCEYSCKNGANPVENPNHKPSSNGCGSFGIQLDVSELPDMKKCCDKHDICYDTCNNDKKICDIQFRKCLDKMCSDAEKQSSHKKSPAVSNCRLAAKLMHSGTTALGCQAYLDAQEKACSCPRRNQRHNNEL